MMVLLLCCVHIFSYSTIQDIIGVLREHLSVVVVCNKKIHFFYFQNLALQRPYVAHVVMLDFELCVCVYVCLTCICAPSSNTSHRWWMARSSLDAALDDHWLTTLSSIYSINSRSWNRLNENKKLILHPSLAHTLSARIAFPTGLKEANLLILHQTATLVPPERLLLFIERTFLRKEASETQYEDRRSHVDD